MKLFAPFPRYHLILSSQRPLEMKHIAAYHFSLVHRAGVKTLKLKRFSYYDAIAIAQAVSTRDVMQREKFLCGFEGVACDARVLGGGATSSRSDLGTRSCTMDEEVRECNTKSKRIMTVFLKPEKSVSGRRRW